MKRILLIVALLSSSFELVSAYMMGTLNTVAHGGTGFGFGSPAQGYISNDQLIIYGSTIQANNKIIAVGQFDIDAPYNSPMIFRYNADGTVDSDFNGTGNRLLFFAQTGYATAVALLSNQNIITVGSHGSEYFVAQTIPVGNSELFTISTHVTDGSTDVAQAVLVDSSDNIYVIGTTTQSATNSIFIAQFNSSGVLQTTYNSTGVTAGTGSAVTQAGIAVFSLSATNMSALGATFDQNNNIIVVGSNGTTDGILCRFTPEGILDTTFGDAVSGGYSGYTTISDVVLSDVGIQSVAYDYAIVTCGSSTTTGIVVDQFDADAHNLISTFTNLCGGSSASSHNLLINSADEIIVGGTVVISAVNNFLLACIQPSVNYFYTSFGTDGYTAGVPNGQVTCLSLQNDGSFVMSGNNGSSITAEYLALVDVPNTSGMIDTSFGTDGGLLIPGGLTTSPESMMITAAGDLIIGVENSDTLVGLTSNYTLNPGFGVAESGLSPVLFDVVSTIADTITDNVGNIYVFGGDGQTSSLSKLSPDGSQVIWSSEISMPVATSIVQQASGRILVAGQSSDNYGIVIAINPSNGVLDTSFNQASSSPGYYYGVQYAPITSLSIVNSTDQIICTQANPNAIVVSVIRLLENGSLDSSFPASIHTPLPSAVAWNAIKMQQDINGKIIVVSLVGTDSASTGFLASRYNANGSDDVVNVAIPAINYSGYSIFLRDLICLSDGTYLILGYNSNGNELILAHLNTDFTLDLDFGDGGILQTAVTSPVTMTNFYALGIGSVEPYNILVSSTDGINPYLLGVISGFSSLVTAVNQSTNSWGPAGTLDTTYNYNSGQQVGFLDLTNEISTNLGSPSAGKSMVHMDNGTYFVLSDNGYQSDQAEAINSYVTKFNADDTQNTNFGDSGVKTIIGMKEACDILLDQNNNIIVVGMVNYPNGLINSYSSVDGWLLWSIATDDFYYNYAVVQQSNGRILVAGASENGPAIQAFNPNTGGRDTTFGNNGIYTLYGGYGFAIHDLVLDSNDNIYFMADKDNVASTCKLSSSGTQLLWTSTTGISSSNSLFEQIALQQNGNVIATSVGTDFATMYFDSYDPSTGISTLELPLSLNLYPLNLYRPRCNALVVDQTSPEGNILVCGGDYESGSVSNTAFIARILPDLSGFDTTCNSTGSLPGVVTVQPNLATGGAEWNNLLIGLNGKITACGYGIISDTKKAYLMRLYGNDFTAQYSPAPVTAGVPGTIDQSFATNGYLDLSAISGPAASQLPQVVLPTSNGYQYVAFDQGALIQLNNGTSLSNFGMSGYGNFAPAGVASMIMDADNRLVLAGTNGSYGWVARYTNNLSGSYDPSFNNGFAVDLGASTSVYQVLEQTLSRIIVAGRNADGDGTIWALTDAGQLDTTFNSNQTPGSYSISTSHIIAAIVADQYDRLVFAHYVSTDTGANLNIVRLTSSGELDTTFGTDGVIAGAIIDVIHATEICIALDAHYNIVVAGRTSEGIVVVAYDSNAQIVYSALTILSLTNPVLQGLIATSDGKILLYGNQISDDSDSMDMWIAQVQNDGDGNYELDTTFALEDVIPGIMQFHNITSTYILDRNCSCIAMYPTGEISMIGYENNDGTNVAFMSRAYNNPYDVTQELTCPLAKPVGTNDLTLGCQGLNGVIYNGTQNTDALIQQAQAIGLQDDQTLLIATNYQGDSSDKPVIIMNQFNIDGLLRTDFNTNEPVYPYGNGSALVLDTFDTQYVQDMLPFTTIDGVNKALLAGYIYNPTLQTFNSLLLQYTLYQASPLLDTSFGGLSGDPMGVAIGSIPSQAYTIGRQSMGRVLVSGVYPSVDTPEYGLIQAYTSNGLLDQSFGNSGYYQMSDTGLFAQVIDSQDRLLYAYTTPDNKVMISRLLADGSGPDLSFYGTGTQTIDYSDYTFPSSQSVKLVLDQDGNIFVAVVLMQAGLPSIAILMLDDNGNLEHNRIFEDRFFGGLSDFSITNLVITASSITRYKRIILIGYDHTSEQDQILVTSFNEYAGEIIQTPYFNQDTTSGYLKYDVQNYSGQTTAHAIIHPDGRIILAGAVSGIAIG